MICVANAVDSVPNAMISPPTVVLLGGITSAALQTAASKTFPSLDGTNRKVPESILGLKVSNRRPFPFFLICRPDQYTRNPKNQPRESRSSALAISKLHFDSLLDKFVFNHDRVRFAKKLPNSMNNKRKLRIVYAAGPGDVANSISSGRAIKTTAQKLPKPIQRISFMSAVS